MDKYVPTYNMLNLSPEQNREANRATCFSMLLSFAFVVTAVALNVSWQYAIGMILGGLILYGGSNIICLPLVKPALEQRPWAILTIKWLQPLVSIALAISMAGYITLIIQLIRVVISKISG